MLSCHQYYSIPFTFLVYYSADDSLPYCYNHVQLWILSGHSGVGGKSLEGVKYGVRPRRLGLAGLGELRGLERRSALEGSRS